jgi:hypothetical protein
MSTEPAADGYAQGYATGQREGARLSLEVHADALEATAMRMATLPDAVQALNEATALLRDAATAVVGPNGLPPTGAELARPAATTPRPAAAEQRQGKRRRRADDA